MLLTLLHSLANYSIHFHYMTAFCIIQNTDLCILMKYYGNGDCAHTNSNTESVDTESG